jgi:hypothetical protein
MKSLCFIAACLALAVSFAPRPSAAQETGAPRFEDYPAATAVGGKVAPLDLRSHPLARKFRTAIRQQLREEGVNFAGHYTFASVGCGTGCAIVALVDARTGRAYFPKEFEGWTSIVGDYEMAEGEDVWMFRAGSRLLRAVGRPNIGKTGEERHGASGIYYYEWADGRLRQVKFVPVGSYPEADPPARP